MLSWIVTSGYYYEINDSLFKVCVLRKQSGNKVVNKSVRLRDRQKQFRVRLETDIHKIHQIVLDCRHNLNIIYYSRHLHSYVSYASLEQTFNNANYIKIIMNSTLPNKFAAMY